MTITILKYQSPIATVLAIPGSYKRMKKIEENYRNPSEGLFDHRS